MIPDEEFDEGNIFCDKHCSSNYEDIREALFFRYGYLITLKNTNFLCFVCLIFIF